MSEHANQDAPQRQVQSNQDCCYLLEGSQTVSEDEQMLEDHLSEGHDLAIDNDDDDEEIKYADYPTTVGKGDLVTQNSALQSNGNPAHEESDNDEPKACMMQYFAGASPTQIAFVKNNQDIIRARQKENPNIYKTGPTKYQDGANKGHWTPEEDQLLKQAVHRFNSKNWKKIAECLEGRTDVQCLHRWQKVLNPTLVKGPWSKEEDKLVLRLVQTHGAERWTNIAHYLPGRIGKQCRERWHNHLNPRIKKNEWSLEEELILYIQNRIHQNKWAIIAKDLEGRTDNTIKNHWNSSMKKKFFDMKKVIETEFRQYCGDL